MKWCTAVRVAGPVSVGLGFVLLRPTWVSVAVLGLLISVAVWLDGQERRADDVEDIEAEVNHRIGNLTDRLNEAGKELTQARETAALSAAVMTKMGERITEIAARLDATAQQRKGPSL